MTDIGISCAKHSYGRTAGKPLVCKPDEEEQAALCYKPCTDGWNGVGPVCWLECPEGTHKCGALCLGPNETCSEFILEQAGVVVKAITSLATGNNISGLMSMANLVSDMKYPICPGTKPELPAVINEEEQEIDDGDLLATDDIEEEEAVPELHPVENG